MVVVLTAILCGESRAITSATISFNVATDSGTNINPSNLLDPAETAGAVKYSATHWNNLFSDWSGNAGALPATFVDSTGTAVSGMTLYYDGPHCWHTNIAPSGGDFKMMRARTE